MSIPKRLELQAGRFALVDGIPFALPVNCDRSPALFAVFPINADKARALLPGNEIHPFRLWKKGLLVVSVIDYRVTDIGKYIEFSIASRALMAAIPLPLFFRRFSRSVTVRDSSWSTCRCPPKSRSREERGSGACRNTRPTSTT